MIHHRYIFFKTEDNYFFDVRTLNRLFDDENDKKKNPYTMKVFSNKTLRKYRKHKKYLKKSKIHKINFDEEIKTPNEEYNEKLINIFKKFIDLGITVDAKWFDNLSLGQLKKLYETCNDIWNFRLQTQYYQRLRMVPGWCGIRYISIYYSGF